jgi:predicted deacylase
MSVGLAERDIESGTAAWVELPIATDADMRPITLRARVVNGTSGGPTLWLQGNVHGDESIGAKAIRDFVLDVDPASVDGAIVGLPVANPIDFVGKERAARINYQGPRDAGRAFPGSEGGSFPAQLAAALFELVEGTADYYVEAHSADKEVYIDPGFVGVARTGDRTEDRSFTLAVAADLPYVVPFPESVVGGFLFAELADRGVPGFMIETGSGGQHYDDAYDAYLRCLGNVARAVGLLPGEQTRTADPAIYTDFSFVATQAGGFVETSVSNGDRIDEGDELGRVTNLEGGIEEVIRAPDDAIVVGIRTYPIARPGDTFAELVIEDSREGPVPE